MEFAEQLSRAGVSDPAAVVRIARNETGFLGGKCRRTAELADLEAHWYWSVSENRPDFGIYGREEYLAEAWACWSVYSRKYLRALAQPTMFPPDGILAALGSVRSVLDLGCGIGYSTAGLKSLFPDADVAGTNLPGTFQTAIAREIGSTAGFRVIPAPDGPVDLIFASEYFEHFEAPLEHLRDVLSVARPRALVVANTFTSPSIGHFPEYAVDGARLSGTVTSRRFNDELRSRGYVPLKTRCWNNRPRVWVSRKDEGGRP